MSGKPARLARAASTLPPGSVMRTAGAAPSTAGGGARAAGRRARCRSGSGSSGSTRGPAIAVAAVRASGCSPAPAAASIAAPRAVVSTSSGRVTGRPVTSARIWRSRSPLRAAGDAHELGGREAGRAHRLEHVAQRVGVALEQRAGHVRAAVRGGEAEPAGAGVGVPLRRHRARPAPAPRATPSAPGRHARGQAVQELVHVGAGAPPPARPRPSPARRGTSGRRRPRASPGSRAASRRDRRAGCSSVTPVGVERGPGATAQTGSAVPITSHTAPGSTTPAPSVAAISSPQPSTTSVARVEPGRLAQPRRDRAEHGVGRPHRRERRRVDPEGGAGLVRPAAAC